MRSVQTNEQTKASTASAMQQAAAAMLAESEGHASYLTRKIARAGMWGRHPQNVQRDVNRALDLPAGY